MNKENNQLALEILMPEETFRRIWGKAQSIKEVADEFEVGEHHAALRGYYLFGEMFL